MTAPGVSDRSPSILHLVDPADSGDEGLICCAAAIDGVSGCTQRVLIIGNAEDERRARALGIDTRDRVPKCSSVWLTSARVRSVISAHSGPRRRKIDVLQCWSLSALSLAARAAPHRSRIGIFTGVPGDDLGDAAAALSGATLCTMDIRGRATLARACSEDRDASAALARVRMIPPPVALPSAPLASRESVRRALGIEPGQTVVSLLADPPGSGDARRVCFALGLNHVLGTNTVALVRRGARQARRATRFNRLNARRWDMISATISIAELIAASDVCVVDTDDEHSGLPSCGPTSVALALAHGVLVAGSAGGVPQLHGIQPMPVLMPSGLRTGSGGLAMPIEQLLRDESTRVAQAHAARSWIEAERARGGFAMVLSGLWSEVTRVPLSAASVA
ncbi:MAG: hypothetical protein K2W85_02225 [Phycisphaerales bacterium]|nr:hypothetical protein [Phycisphaerales bacterium]